MAQTLQEVFLRIQEKKEKRKDVRRTYKDVLEASPKYRAVMEEVATLREKKLQIVTAIQSECADELATIDTLTSDIETDEMLMTDMAITQYAKGESIMIKDAFEHAYEPVFVVKFKKSGA